MLTLSSLLSSLDKSDKNQSYINWETIVQECLGGFFPGTTPDESEYNDLKSYWSINWICTDTCVGIRFYFLNDEFVAASYQPARKDDEYFEWASNECFDKVKQYILSVLLKNLPQTSCSLLNLEEDVSSIQRRKEEIDSL